MYLLTDQNSTSLFTFSGHSGPITALLISTPVALSASGSTVRMWNIENGTCIKLLQHSPVPSTVLCMSWIPTYKGVFTIDAENTLRTFSFHQTNTCLEVDHEIIKPNSSKLVEKINGVVETLDAIPNQLSIISVKSVDCDYPSVNLKVFDFGH